MPVRMALAQPCAVLQRIVLGYAHSCSCVLRVYAQDKFIHSTGLVIEFVCRTVATYVCHVQFWTENYIVPATTEPFMKIHVVMA